MSSCGENIIINGKEFLNGDFISIDHFQNEPEILVTLPSTEYDPYNDEPHPFCVVITDSDVPKGFIHLIRMNIFSDNPRGSDEILKLLPPNPPRGKVHRYHIHVYIQRDYTQPPRITSRSPFNLKKFVRDFELLQRCHLTFKTGHISRKEEIVSIADEDNSNLDKSDYFVKGHPLSERQQAFCRCVNHVGYSSIDRPGYNKNSPYAICNKTTHGGGGRVPCDKYYNYEKLSDSDLQGFAFDHDISIPKPYNRQEMMTRIKKWKKSKGE